ncbi:hypothetical protein EC988_006849, partial [Linderina pennispora]
MTVICHFLNRHEMSRQQDPLYVPRFQFRPRDAPNKQENVFEEHELSLLRTKILTEDELRELLTTQLDKYSRITCSCSSDSSNKSTDKEPTGNSSSDKLLSSAQQTSTGTDNGTQHIISIDIVSSTESCECAISRNFFTPDCSVCLRDFEAGSEVRILVCGHYFHTDCIDAWLTKHSATCPVCKSDMVSALNLPPRKPTAPAQNSQTSDVAQAPEVAERGSSRSS